MSKNDKPTHLADVTKEGCAFMRERVRLNLEADEWGEVNETLMRGVGEREEGGDRDDDHDQVDRGGIPLTEIAARHGRDRGANREGSCFSARHERLKGGMAAGR